MKMSAEIESEGKITIEISNEATAPYVISGFNAMLKFFEYEWQVAKVEKEAK